ncbi:AAA family ATPase [Candidatus Gracilibacteria bacterium]|nr:AAA family ATPase [Candidatus Gracilibacteria bacterium]
MSELASYLPIDRRYALAQGVALGEESQGAALFADIVGFVPLTDALVQAYGARRGVEVLIAYLNHMYDVLVEELHRYGGSVIDFVGDAITCWFHDQPIGPYRPHTVAALRAAAAALAMQRALAALPALDLPHDEQARAPLHIAIKISIASGRARRMSVGDPAHHVLDTLAGATMARMAAGERLARPGEVLLDAETVRQAGERLLIDEWRTPKDGAVRFGRLAQLAPLAECRWPPLAIAALTPAHIRPWLHPTIYERLTQGQNELLTELRPAVALFLRFTDLAYDSDPQAQQKLDAFIRWVQQVLARREGVLLQLTIGDKGSFVYIVFGAPVAHEDDAQRAVLAALELVDLPAALAALGPIRVGISSGTMRTGIYGSHNRRTYGVLGDEVNLAIRLMQHAAPGQVLVSARVQQACGRSIDWQPLDPITVKGKRTPVPVAIAIRANDTVVNRLQEPVYRYPLVGRADELAALKRRFEEARDGKGQILGISGAAGMGKSRLVDEVLRHGRAYGVTYLLGQGAAYRSGSALLIWQSIWRALFAIDDAAAPEEQQGHLAAWLAAVDPQLVQRLPLLSAVLDLPIADNSLTRSLDPQLAAASREALLLDCLRAFVRSQAHLPLVVVLEDLHWIDSASFDLLLAVSRAIAELPVLLLLTYRPALAAEQNPARLDDTTVTFTPCSSRNLTTVSGPNWCRCSLVPCRRPCSTGCVSAQTATLFMGKRSGITSATRASICIGPMRSTALNCRRACTAGSSAVSTGWPPNSKRS